MSFWMSGPPGSICHTDSGHGSSQMIRRRRSMGSIESGNLRSSPELPEVGGHALVGVHDPLLLFCELVADQKVPPVDPPERDPRPQAGDQLGLHLVEPKQLADAGQLAGRL